MQLKLNSNLNLKIFIKFSKDENSNSGIELDDKIIFNFTKIYITNTFEKIFSIKEKLNSIMFIVEDLVKEEGSKDTKNTFINYTLRSLNDN